jgi:hypothetical protein
VYPGSAAFERPRSCAIRWAPFGVSSGKAPFDREEREMTNGTTDRGAFGIGLGGILVIVGIVVAIVWSVWIGILIALVGLVAFGGFAKGKWY